MFHRSQRIVKLLLAPWITRIGGLAAIYVLSACHTPHPTTSPFRCGLSDPETVANLGICEFAAEYYVAHHRWPLSKAQLQSQVQTALQDTGSEITPEQSKELSKFLDRYTILEFHSKGADLVLHYRIKVEQQIIEHTVTLKPGRTAEEIMDHSVD